MGTIILSAFVAHTGWHWLEERAGQLSQFPVPAFDLAMLAVMMQWLTVLVTIAALAWFAKVVLKPLVVKWGRRSFKEDGPAGKTADAGLSSLNDLPPLK